MPQQVLTDAQRTKQDTRPDPSFYRTPRFVQHVDEAFREHLTHLYRDRLSSGDRVLDLMSSWVSHLPEEMDFSEVIGHGLNAEELDANPALDRYFVQNLNATPTLPLDDDAVDAVLCAVSVQYLQAPEHVFAEVGRILRPGGVVIVSFSNRMFAQKAIRAWREASGPERARLVEQYLNATEAFDAPETISYDAATSPQDWFFGGLPDPFYAVVATASDPTSR